MRQSFQNEGMNSDGLLKDSQEEQLNNGIAFSLESEELKDEDHMRYHTPRWAEQAMEGEFEMQGNERHRQQLNFAD